MCVKFLEMLCLIVLFFSCSLRIAECLCQPTRLSLWLWVVLCVLHGRLGHWDLVFLLDSWVLLRSFLKKRIH